MIGRNEAARSAPSLRALRRGLGFGLVLVLVLALAGACASYHAPTITGGTTPQLDASQPIFVFAERKRDGIVAALEDAGFLVTSDLREVGYAVEARIGASRGVGDCGEIRNVVYTLLRQGRTLFEIKARGGTGDCDSNIFDEVAALLAGYRSST